jgi:hypothetical protein
VKKTKATRVRKSGSLLQSRTRVRAKEDNLSKKLIIGTSLPDDEND